MKRRLVVFLILELIVCAVMLILGQSAGNSLVSAAVFPFEQLGNGLRTLSLSGDAGNVAAIILYCVICLLPSVYLAVRALRDRSRMEDGLLVLLSIALFAVLYLMINPAYIARHFGAAELLDMSKALCGFTVYSVLVGYIILRAMRTFTSGKTEALTRYLKILLGALCAIFVYAIFSDGIVGFINASRQLAEANIRESSSELLPGYLFLGIQRLVAVLPHAFSIAVVFRGFDLIKALEEDAYGASVSVSARGIGGICKRAVVCIMLSQIAVNLLQLALGAVVRSGHYTLSIPLPSVIFVLVALLLARYFEQARLLKDDNDSII